MSNSIFSDGAAAAILQADLNGDTTGGVLKRLLPMSAAQDP